VRSSATAEDLAGASYAGQYETVLDVRLEPMTPLFADWLLDRLDHGEQQATRAHVGAALEFPHAAINGWYYLGAPALSPRTILTTLPQGRGRLLRFLRDGVHGPGRDPVAADRIS
jgi:pyruvate,water dikinase